MRRIIGTALGMLCTGIASAGVDDRDSSWERRQQDEPVGGDAGGGGGRLIW